MHSKATQREELITRLDQTVSDAAQFFAEASETLSDGHQTARAVLAHIVFWRREYVETAEMLVTGRQRRCRAGTFAALNAVASRQMKDEPMRVLAHRLVRRQHALALALRRAPDWTIDFPIKVGGAYCSISERVGGIESHIRNHVIRLRRAARRPGQAGHCVGGATIDVFAMPGARYHMRRVGSVAATAHA